MALLKRQASKTAVTSFAVDFADRTPLGGIKDVIADVNLLEAIREARIVAVDNENGFIVLFDDLEARLLSTTIYDSAVDAHIALCYGELSTIVGKRIPLPLEKGVEDLAKKMRLAIDSGPAHAIRLVIGVEEVDETSSDSSEEEPSVRVTPKRGFSLQTGRGYMYDVKQFAHTHSMTAFVPQPKRDERTGMWEQGDTANLFPLKIRTSRAPWALNQNTILIGPKAIHLREYHIFEGKIRYGLDNDAFWKQSLTNWYSMYLRKPYAASEWHNEAKQYGWAENGHPYYCTLTAIGIKPSDHPDGLPLLLNRLFNALIEPSQTLEEIAEEHTLNSIVRYCQLAKDCTTPCLHDALSILRVKLSNNAQVVDSILLVANEEAEVRKWFDIFASFLSPPFDITNLQLQIQHLQSSNLPLFNRIISSIKHAMKLKANPPESSSTAFTEALERLEDHRWEFVQKSMRGVFVQMHNDNDKVSITAMGRKFSSNPHLLRSNWKYYSHFIQFASSPSEAEPTKMDTNLDFGSRLTPKALLSLLQYFATGDPNITSYVDAYGILEMAEELFLCDSKGNAIYGHESIMNQLIFTIQTARVSEKDSFTGLALAYTIQSSKLQEKCESRIRQYFDQIANSPDATWFNQTYPDEYSALAWSTVLPTVSKGSK